MIMLEDCANFLKIREEISKWIRADLPHFLVPTKVLGEMLDDG